MKTRPCLAAMLLPLLLTLIATSQSNDRFLVMTGIVATNQARIHEIDHRGQMVSTVTTFFPAFYLTRLVMAEDNRSIRALGFWITPPPVQNIGGIMDVSPNGVIRTLSSGYPLSQPINTYPDQNGDWIVVNRWPNSPNGGLRIHRLSGTTLTSLSTVLYMWAYGVSLNEETGRLMVRCTFTNLSRPDGFWEVDPATGAITTITRYGTSGSWPLIDGFCEPLYDAASDVFIDVIKTGLSSPLRMIAVHRSKFTTLANQGLSGYPYDITRVHSRDVSAAAYLFERTSLSPYTVQIAKLALDGSRVGTGVIVTGVVPVHQSVLLRKGSRNLVWALDQKPNDRGLKLSFPGEVGRAYGVGFSLTGVRPSPRLADGRPIPIVPDGLTRLCLSGGVPGVLEHTVGILNAKGEARVKVYLNRFGNSLRGLRLWAAALVIDPQAPSSVAAVAGPIGLTVQ